MIYKRLPGRRRGVIRGASLWAAEDHLLAIESNRFTESYKRYYFTDIQAVTMKRVLRPAFGPLLLSIALLSILWFVAVIGVSIYGAAVGTPIWTGRTFYGLGVAFLSILGLLVAYHALLWFFFTCECRVHTATSRDQLRSLHRTWTARKAMSFIDDKVRAAQGELPSDWQSRLDLAYASAPVAAPAPVEFVPVAVQETPSRLNIPVFSGLMLGTAAAGVALFLLPGNIFAETALTLLLVIVAIVTMVYAVRLAGPISKLMTVLAIASVLLMMVAYAAESAFSMRMSAKSIKDKDSPVARAFNAIDDAPLRRVPPVGAAVLGLGGMLGAVMLMRGGKRST